MKLAAKDLASMKLPFLVLAVAIAASFLLVKFSADKRDKAEMQHRIQSTTLQDARSRYQRSGEERETIQRYLPAYQQLENQGFVGTEQRINWLEGLRLANTGRIVRRDLSTGRPEASASDRPKQPDVTALAQFTHEVVFRTGS